MLNRHFFYIIFFFQPVCSIFFVIVKYFFICQIKIISKNDIEYKIFKPNQKI